MVPRLGGGEEGLWNGCGEAVGGRGEFRLLGVIWRMTSACRDGRRDGQEEGDCLRKPRSLLHLVFKRKE